MLAAIDALTGFSFEGRPRSSIERVTDDVRDAGSTMIAYGLSAARIPPELASSNHTARVCV